MTKEIKVGLFTILAGAILYIGFNFLKGIDVFSDEDIYYVIYDQTPGLLESNAIKMNGVQVGTVKDIAFLPSDINKIQVTLSIDSDIRIPRNTLAMLADNGLLGEKMIDLSIKNREGGYYEGGDTLPGKIEESVLSALQKKADPLAVSLQSTMDSAQQLMAIYAEVGIKAQGMLIEATKMITQNQIVLNNSLKELQGTLNTLNTTLPSVVTKLETFTDSLNQSNIPSTIADAQQTVNELQKTLDAINKAEGTMGKLVKDQTLHTEMVQTMQDLDALLIDFKEHPKRYVHFSVFGKKDKGSKKDEPKEVTEQDSTKDSK
ncbi:MlaD family protein [Limibacter armeniacum]|uniref:MlaD family protein n=1 Tax=Limibacter armeniacum TaxID=466084 RepID=UPI002FE6B7F0